MSTQATEKTITILVREDDFDVKFSDHMTMEELYIVCVSIMQQIEEFIDDSSCIYGSTMVQ